jgi:hypothetical protein
MHPSSGHKNKSPGNTQEQKTGTGPLKYQEISTTLHIVTSQKTVVFTVEAVKTSNFTQKHYLHAYYLLQINTLRKVRIAPTFQFNFRLHHY